MSVNEHLLRDRELQLMHQIKNLTFLIITIFTFTTLVFYDLGFSHLTQMSQESQSHFIPQSEEEKRVTALLHSQIIQDDLDGLRAVLDIYPQYINAVKFYRSYNDLFTLLQQAAKLNRDNFVDELLDRGANPLLLTLRKDDSILHFSTISGNTVKKFIDIGLNIEARNAKDMTPLLAHVSKRVLNTEAIHALLTAKADVEARVFENGFTVLHILFNPYHYYSQHNQENLLIVLQSLLDHGARLNAETKEHGATPLHFAAERNDAQAIEKMVKKAKQVGIKNFINIKNFSGNTALFIAYTSRSRQAFTELLRLEADPLLKNRFDRSVNGKAHRGARRGARQRSAFAQFALDEINKYFRPNACTSPLTNRNESPSYVSN